MMAGPWEKYQKAPASEGPWTKYRQPSEPEAETEEQPKTEQGLRGDTAAFLRGVSEQIPFARDIGAAAKAYVGNPLTGERPTGDFAKSKRALETRNAQLAAEHPWSYGAGEVAGGVGSLAVPEAMGANLIGRGAQAEAAVANKLAPILRSPAEAKLLAGAGTGAVAGAAQGAIHGLGTGTSAEDRLSNATGEALVGAPLGAAGSAVGHLGARAVRKAGELAGVATPKAKLPTSQDILSQASREYDYAKSFGTKVKSSAVNDLYKKIMSDFRKEAYNPGYNEHAVMNTPLRELSSVSQPLTLDDLDILHRMSNAAAKDWTNPTGQNLARIYRKNFREFMDNLTPNELITPPKQASQAVNAWNNARNLWKKGKKIRELQMAESIAANRAAKSGVGGNFNNLYRSEVEKILAQANKAGGSSPWTIDERRAMEDFVKGGVTQNLARNVGRLSPAHHGMMATAELIAAMSHPGAAAATAAAGLTGRKLEDYLTKAAGEELKSLVAVGGKRANIPKYNPLESVRGRAVGIPSTTSPVFTPALEAPVFAEDYEDREERASGGRLSKRDYPAKRLTRVEKALKRAQQSIALETKPLLDHPDEHIAQALDIAMNK